MGCEFLSFLVMDYWIDTSIVVSLSSVVFVKNRTIVLRIKQGLQYNLAVRVAFQKPDKNRYLAANFCLNNKNLVKNSNYKHKIQRKNP